MHLIAREATRRIFKIIIYSPNHLIYSALLSPSAPSYPPISRHSNPSHLRAIRHLPTSHSYTYSAMRVLSLVPNIFGSPTNSTTPRHRLFCQTNVPVTPDSHSSNFRLHSSITSLDRSIPYAVLTTSLVNPDTVHYLTPFHKTILSCPTCLSPIPPTYDPRFPRQLFS